MQLSQNPITKIINEKLKFKDFNNLSNLIFDQERITEFHFKFQDLNIDITRQNIDKEIKDDLINLAKKTKIKSKIKQMISGSKINRSENRSVGHFNLRKKEYLETKEWKNLINFTKRILNKKSYKNIVNVGVGGSHLGPSMVNQALKSFYKGPKIFYVSNIDPINLIEVFGKCNPKTTLFIITSKSFGTLETLENAKMIKNWLEDSNISLNDGMIAVTSSEEKAKKWGFEKSNIFHVSNNIGGRYSLWSSVGITILFGLGEDNYKKFLHGAHTMDEHFANEDIENNIPIILALLRVWNRNFLNRNNHCIIPYTNSLSKLPAWVQQLEMESNGKNVDVEGQPLEMPASPVIWGEVGTNAQHSFFQFLHQSLETTPVDILIPRKPIKNKKFNDIMTNHKHLIINAIAQAEALAIGSVDPDNENKNFPGNRPSTIISWEDNNPFSIGMLISLYENITIASGFLWNINSFDQWGVELGKSIADQILNDDGHKKLSLSAKYFFKE